MSLSEEKKILLSQLVDGELPVDQANQVLADVFGQLTHVLGSSEAATELNAMLELRQALGSWRSLEAPRPVVVMPSVNPGNGAARSRWHLASMAAAALVGGILVAGGFLLAHLLAGPRADTSIARQPALPMPGTSQGGPKNRQPAIVVTPQQRHEIAQAFALHESVAGPLSWYAADESSIRVAPADKQEKTEQPIAVVLRLLPDGGPDESHPKTYVIVCRNNDPAVIELPHNPTVRSAHLRLVSKVVPGGVYLQYALAADSAQNGTGDSAALVGRRHVGFEQTSLGQLALNDRLVNVDASAWAMSDEQKN